MAIFLQKGSLITLNGTELSEHNRQPAKVDYEVFQINKRTLTGTLRRQSVSYKRKISISWDLLPGEDSQTVDLKAGRDTIVSIVGTDWTLSTTPITVLYKSDVNYGSPETVYCFVESYDEELAKRHNKWLWNVSLTLIEV